jgi:hypothetical protein
MANPDHLLMLKQGVDFWNMMRARGGLREPPDLYEADFVGGNLSRANLSQADLHNADLHSANLSGADLSQADLSGVDLRGANLDGANLHGANLFGADLTAARVTGVDISEADLTGALIPEQLILEEAIAQREILTFVEIALPQSHISKDHIENLQDAVKNFMESCGFKLLEELDTRYGSFFQRLKFLVSKEYTRKEVAEMYQKSKEALQKTYLDKPGAEVADKLADAATKLISSLESVDSGVLRLGELLVVKITRHGKSYIRMETISPELARALARKPYLHTQS